MIRFYKYISLPLRHLAMLGTQRGLVLLVSAVSIAFAACTPRGHGDDTTASFALAEDVRATSSEVSRQVPGFGIPTARLYNFKACLVNRRTQERIRLAPFEVIGASKDIKTRTDDGGCLNWSEEIPFNLLTDERYLTLERDIRAAGMESGSRRVRIGLNPWMFSKGASAVIDLDRSKSVPTQTLSAKESVAYVQGSSDGGRPLSVSHLAIENTPIQSAQSIARRFRITLRPVILLKDMFGQPVSYPLPTAKLKASVRLLAINAVAGEDRTIEIGGENDIPVVADGDFFRFDYSPRIQSANRNSRFQLAIQLNPIDGPADLLPYKSLYAIGDFAMLTGAQMLPAILRDRDYTQSPGLPADLPIESGDPQTNQHLAPIASGIRRATPFEIGEIKVEFMGIQAENAIIRKVLFRSTTCITDLSNGGKPAVDEDFKVEIGEGRARRTQQMIERFGPGLEGCYSWEDSITHRYYEAELFYHVPVEIKHFQSGFSERRVLGVNPWDRFLIGLDSKISKATIDTFNSRRLTPSRLTTDAIIFETVGERKYNVDEFLNLRMLKTVQVRVPMRVERFSNMIAGRSAPPEVLRKGIWGFRAMIYMRGKHFTGEEFEEFIPMEGGYQLTSSQAGDVKARVDINIADPRLFRTRSLIVFEIVPIDESKLNPQELATMSLDPDHRYEDVIERESKLVTPTFSAPIIIGEEVTSRVPFPTDILIAGGRPADDDARHLQGLSYDQLLERAKRLDEARLNQSRARQSLVGFLKNSNLDYVSLYNEPQLIKSNPGLATANTGFPNTDSAKALIHFLNFKFPTGILNRFYESFNSKQPVTIQDVQSFVEGKRELDKSMAARFCMVLMRQVIAPVLPKPKDAFKACLTAVGRDFFPTTDWTSGGHKGHSVFAIDHSMRIFETDGGTRVATDRPSLTFNVGADTVSMQAQAATGTVSVHAQVGASLLSLLKKNPVTEFVTAGVSLGVGGSYNISRQISESGVLNSNQQIVMEMIELDLNAKRYESCTSIRMRADFWSDHPALVKGSKLAPEELVNRLNRGLYICTGFEDKTPRKIREKFVSFAQPMHEGTRLDQGDFSNYPFMISVRGANDYVRFLNLISARKTNAFQASEDYDVMGYPLSRLNDAFKAFNSRLPTQPGTYVRPESIPTVERVNIDFPWWLPNIHGI